MDFFGYAPGTPWGALEWIVFILFVVVLLEIVFILPATCSVTWRRMFFPNKKDIKRRKEELEREEQMKEWRRLKEERKELHKKMEEKRNGKKFYSKND